MGKPAEKVVVTDRDWTVTTRELSDLFMVTPRAIQLFVKSGMPKLSHGNYDLRQCIAWRIEKLQDKRATPPEDGSEADERRMLIRAQTAKYEVETDKLRGTLVDAELVGQVMNEVAALVAAQLDGLAPRVAGDLVGLADKADIQAKLFVETRQIRSSISRAIIDYAGGE